MSAPRILVTFPFYSRHLVSLALTPPVHESIHNTYVIGFFMYLNAPSGELTLMYFREEFRANYFRKDIRK